jgi:hypothetical protein
LGNTRSVLGGEVELKNPNIKTDCFAIYYDVNNYPKCSALRELVCKKEKCSFYKTQNQYDEEAAKYLPSRRYAQ